MENMIDSDKSPAYLQHYPVLKQVFQEIDLMEISDKFDLRPRRHLHVLIAYECVFVL